MKTSFVFALFMFSCLRLLEAQDVELVLGGMENQIVTKFERQAFDTRRYVAYPEDKTPSRYIPSMRVYFFADSMQPDTSAFLSGEKIAKCWTDAYIGAVCDPIYRKPKLAPSQAKDSLRMCLKNRFASGNTLIQNQIWRFLIAFLRPDAILYPAFVYYSVLDSTGVPIEWNWCKMKVVPFWQDGTSEPPVACLESRRGWLLKDGSIYTGAMLDVRDSLVLLGIQAYMDSLRVYPSFARYFNGLDTGQCIPSSIRSRIASILAWREDSAQRRVTRKERRKFRYGGLYFLMGFPSPDWSVVYEDYPFPVGYLVKLAEEKVQKEEKDEK